MEQLGRSRVLFCLIGPAGSGKTTLCERWIGEYGNSIRYSTSVTTRAPRPGEISGQSYHFVTREEFQQSLDKGDFFEWEEIHGNLYGTLRGTIVRAIEGGVDLLLAVDIHGALKVKESFSANTVNVFLVPSSSRELVDRIRNRSAITEEELHRRLATAKHEYQKIVELLAEGPSSGIDYLLVNRDLERTYKMMRRIVETERLKLHRFVREDVAELCTIGEMK